MAADEAQAPDIGEMAKIAGRLASSAYTVKYHINGDIIAFIMMIFEVIGSRATMAALSEVPAAWINKLINAKLLPR